MHIHVRDPAMGRPSMELKLYEDVVARIRAANSELIINITTGPAGPEDRRAGNDIAAARAARGAHCRAQAGYLRAQPEHNELGW